MPEIRLPLIAVQRAIEVMQDSNLEALRTGDRRGHSTLEMAEILDRELGFTDLYNSAKSMCNAVDKYTDELDNILALALIEAQRP